MFFGEMLMHTTWSMMKRVLPPASEAASAAVVGEMMSCSATMSIISAYILAAEGHGLPT